MKSIANCIQAIDLPQRNSLTALAVCDSSNLRVEQVSRRLDQAFWPPGYLHSGLGPGHRQEVRAPGVPAGETGPAGSDAVPATNKSGACSDIGPFFIECSGKTSTVDRDALYATLLPVRLSRASRRCASRNTKLAVYSGKAKGAKRAFAERNQIELRRGKIPIGPDMVAIRPP